MAFIRTTKNKEGRQHVYLVEGYRENGKVKQRIIHKYGLLDELEAQEPGILDRLKREAKENSQINPEKLTVDYSLKDSMNRPDLKYGWKILEDIYSTLKLDRYFSFHQSEKSDTNLSQVAQLLFFQRILKPDSKHKTFISQEHLFGNWNVPYNAVYRSLDQFDQLKNDLQQHIHREITQLTDRKATLVFYDVTNYYFEVDVPDEDVVDEEGNVIVEGLRKRGASKEYRRDPIVQLGLFMDSNGIPISYKLFRGNFSDPKTYIPAIQEAKKQFGIERLVVVADKAMNSADNLLEMLSKEDGWIFSQKHRGRRGAPKDIQEHILDTSDWAYNQTLTFAKKSYIRTRKLGTGKNAPQVQEKVLITWNEKYAIREKLRREGALEYASKLTNAELYRQTSKKGGKKYLDVTYIDSETGEVLPYSPVVQINQEEVDFDAQFDGINVLVTSEIDKEDDEIIEAYQELSKIEDCFRVTKTEFESRPVYVRKPSHIEGHFLICFISLVLMRLLQHTIQWKMSPRKIVEALNSMEATPLVQGFYRVQQSELMDELNNYLGIHWTKGVVRVEEINSYGKKCIHNTLSAMKTSKKA
ncbi:IS1634 family transposase [Tuanshanicoccus lijuaniae]|uniref:IS1634 family transposase n=1 Tax=Aerococcaceae bacterium zg-1292 TaxID=2774330 RepID=UPI001935FE31|nr:IS1634 family transposase [Aerococcaceae bacterium zg-1292]